MASVADDGPGLLGRGIIDTDSGPETQEQTQTGQNETVTTTDGTNTNAARL